jgi:hypothetical protein
MGQTRVHTFNIYAVRAHLVSVAMRYGTAVWVEACEPARHHPNVGDVCHTEMRLVPPVYAHTGVLKQLRLAASLLHRSCTRSASCAAHALHLHVHFSGTHSVVSRIKLLRPCCHTLSHLWFESLHPAYAQRQDRLTCLQETGCNPVGDSGNMCRKLSAGTPHTCPCKGKPPASCAIDGVGVTKDHPILPLTFPKSE